MLTEQTRVDILRVAVEQVRRESPADFAVSVAKIYAEFYNLIDSDVSPAKPERKARQGKPPEPEIFG